MARYALVVLLLVIHDSVHAQNASTIMCSARLVSNYRQVNDHDQKSINDMKWCLQAQEQSNVIVGKSYGSLGRNDQIQWEQFGCNEYVVQKRVTSCDDAYGLTVFQEWKNEFRRMITGESQVDCAHTQMGYAFCRFHNVSIDFSKARVSGNSRIFNTGFFTTYGENIESTKPQMEIFSRGGYQHVNGRIGGCDIIESRPVFVTSHDDMFNYGHHMEDVASLWSAMYLVDDGVNFEDSLLLNIDALRSGGPGGPGRLMCSSQQGCVPDGNGPFVDYYKSWFYGMRRPADYGNKKVCFDKLYLKPDGRPWVWKDWSLANKCSKKGPSPMWQSFSIYCQAKFTDYYGLKIPLAPSIEEVRVVMLVRRAENKGGSGARVITNVNALVQAIEAIAPNVRVVSADFAGMSFREQWLLMQSTSVFVAMHGAGSVHVTNMAVGSPNCCAFVELFPAESVGFSSIRGYGNVARWLGVRYYRYQTPEGKSSAMTGSEVEVAVIEALIRRAVVRMHKQPSCLNFADN